MKFKCKYCNLTEKMGAVHYCKIKHESVVVANNNYFTKCSNIVSKALNWAFGPKPLLTTQEALDKIAEKDKNE